MAFHKNKTIAIKPNQGVSIEIKSLFNFKGDKRITMFPLGFLQIMIEIRT